MERRLILVRHAKSAWDQPHLADHDRPLAPRGRKALDKIGAFVGQLDVQALTVICSTAERARATFAGVRPTIPDDTSIEFARSVYDADAPRLLDIVRGVDDRFMSAMVVGHNPTLQELATSLLGAGDGAERRQIAAKLPTGAVVAMSFHGAWGDLRPGDAVLDGLFMPRRPRP